MRSTRLCTKRCFFAIQGGGSLRCAIILYGWKFWPCFQGLCISSTIIGAILLIFSHSDFLSLNFGMLKDEQEKLKRMTWYKASKFAHFWYSMNNYLIFYWSKSTSYWTVSYFTSKYIFRFCLIIWYKLYSDYCVENESIIFLSRNGKYEIL